MRSMVEGAHGCGSLPFAPVVNGVDPVIDRVIFRMLSQQPALPTNVGAHSWIAQVGKLHGLSGLGRRVFTPVGNARLCPGLL